MAKEDCNVGRGDEELGAYRFGVVGRRWGNDPGWLPLGEWVHSAQALFVRGYIELA
jgi:hypothetical protein